MYKLIIRPILYSFQPEKAHHLTTGLLKFICAIPGVSFFIKAIHKVEDAKLNTNVLILVILSVLKGIKNSN